MSRPESGTTESQSQTSSEKQSNEKLIWAVPASVKALYEWIKIPSFLIWSVGSVVIGVLGWFLSVFGEWGLSVSIGIMSFVVFQWAIVGISQRLRIYAASYAASSVIRNSHTNKEVSKSDQDNALNLLDRLVIFVPLSQLFLALALSVIVGTYGGRIVYEITIPLPRAQRVPESVGISSINYYPPGNFAPLTINGAKPAFLASILSNIERGGNTERYKVKVITAWTKRFSHPTHTFDLLLEIDPERPNRNKYALNGYAFVVRNTNADATFATVPIEYGSDYKLTLNVPSCKTGDRLFFFARVEVEKEYDLPESPKSLFKLTVVRE